MTQDRFGNPLAPGLPYARGRYLTGTADDAAKLRAAWGHMRRRWVTLGPDDLARLGGPGRMAEAIDDCLTRLGVILKEPAAFRALILDGPAPAQGAEGR